MICGSTTEAYAQLTPEEAANAVQLNTITTAVPFLMIAPDSRSGALGEPELRSMVESSC